jgi:hypothetical protein
MYVSSASGWRVGCANQLQSTLSPNHKKSDRNIVRTQNPRPITVLCGTVARVNVQQAWALFQASNFLVQSPASHEVHLAP